MYWLTEADQYYEGDRQSATDLAVTRRPSAGHIRSNGQWVSGPAVAKKLVPLDFLNLFTESEQLAVVSAGLSNAVVRLWYDRALAATYITRDDPQVETGLTALVGAGLLTEERRAAVLAAMLDD